MANPTYILIQSVTLTTTAATVTLGSGGTIPQTYTDLKIVWSTRANSNGGIADGSITFNGSSTGYGSSKMLYGTGSSALSAAQTQGYIQWSVETPDTATTANTFSNGEMYIPNYTSSNYKSISMDQVTENNATAGYQFMNVGIWNNAAAITSITLSVPTVSFVTNSTFYLYGIKNS